jgi:hypothetical protein
VFASGVLNVEFEDRIFPISYRIQSSFTLYTTATMSETKRMNPESNLHEIYATLMNMLNALPKEELWEEKAALVRAKGISPHVICAFASRKSAARKGNAVNKKDPDPSNFPSKCAQR